MESNSKYNMSKALGIFFTESREMLSNMESCLLEIEKDPDNPEIINSLFRAVHTIKGSSGMFNLTEIESFTHKIENVLDDLRKGKIIVTPELTEILLEAHDYIGTLLNTHENNPESILEEDQKNIGIDINKRLMICVDYDIIDNDSAQTDTQVKNKYWHISLRYKERVFINGLDPLSFINYLNEIGRIINIITIDDNIPPLSELNPEECYLGFEIDFDSDCEKQKIIDVFEFVKDDCDIRVLSPLSVIDEYVSLINQLPETPMRIGDILVKAGSLTTRELETALAIKNQNSEALKENETGSLIGEIMIQEKMLHQPVLDAALEKQKAIVRAEDRKNKSIRIDAEKIDDLINIVGELVITGANLRQLLEENPDPNISQAITTMSRLIEDVRDKIMNVRMVQIGDSFKRFERIVRDLSKETGKQIEFRVNGADTELDKTLVEKINDPIMHLIRNSIDHGIDTPESRKAKGKNPKGLISINAFHETGSVVIEIRDDGSGLNKEKIHAKAIERGVIVPDQILSDDEIYQLIFEPGFSTADKVTNISGRGVGMDVVKRNIDALRGTIHLESNDGAGMTVRIHLPLTLAIIDGFMVTVSDSYYIVPLDLVREVFEITHDELITKEGANIINLRGEVLPFMRLRDFFGQSIEIENTNDSFSECVMVVEYARRKAGIVVDLPVGEFQTVIKSLGKLFQELTWASGATILGSGEVALVLDVPHILQSKYFVDQLTV